MSSRSKANPLGLQEEEEEEEAKFRMCGRSIASRLGLKEDEEDEEEQEEEEEEEEDESDNSECMCGAKSNPTWPCYCLWRG